MYFLYTAEAEWGRRADEVTVRAWLEHLPDTLNLNTKFKGYMHLVRKRNKEAMDAEKTKLKQAMGKIAFAIGKTYGYIAIAVFGGLLSYWLYLGFTQSCHNLVFWAEWLFSFLF